MNKKRTPQHKIHKNFIPLGKLLIDFYDIMKKLESDENRYGKQETKVIMTIDDITTLFKDSSVDLKDKNKMIDLKLRLKSEQIKLQDKLKKLNDFIKSNDCKKINDIEKTLLNVRVGQMKTHNKILLEQIGNL